MIGPAEPHELDTVRTLFREYAELVSEALCFQSYEAELTGLPGAYVRLLVWRDQGEVQACVGLREIAEGIGEMKRLYVRPAYQGRGLGRALTLAVMEEARQLGHRLLRLDTLPRLSAAVALYHSMGFRVIPPYGDNPPMAVCFEINLT